MTALLGPQWGETAVAPPPAGLKSLRALADTLERLTAAVDGADGPPTPDAADGFASLQADVAATLAAWETLKTKALP